MFSDKFVRLPIRVYNRDEQDLTGDAMEIDTYEMVNPFTIGSYRPTTDPEGGTTVTFKDGTSMMIYMTIQEFESYMNNHQIFKP